jgi:hypothetical protein
MQRIGSLREFWPYYLSEHRHPASRALHFVGTTWFFATMGIGLALNPIWTGAALAFAVLVGAWGATRVEPDRAAFVPMLLIVVPVVAAAPVVLAGVVGAYACAWVGHFRVERNRPATFRYPVWSFLCDFVLWSEMARGRRWSGDPGAAV